MRAFVLGPVRLLRDGYELAQPVGHVGALLQFLLLRPNETHSSKSLSALLWPDLTYSKAALSRLQVTVSRLRRFLVEASRDEDDSALRLVTESNGYRLQAGEDVLDRVRFESLAARALNSEPHLAGDALSLWTGDPYSGFAWSEDLGAVRAHLARIRDALEMLRLQLPGQSLIRTKFLRPILDSTTVPREQLLERAPVVGDSGLLFVGAPAGFGKSIFLSQWTSVQENPVAWVSLDPEDNDPVRFWTVMLAGLADALGLSSTAIDGNPAPGSPRFFQALAEIERAAATPFGIVLDDFHHIVRADLHDQIWRHLIGLSERVTVAISSRGPIPQQWAPARAVHLAAGDLCFNEREIDQALELSAGSAEDAEAVRRLTEGWPIAVTYLSRSGLPADQLSGAMDQYLVEEVLSELPEPVVTFLTQTAHLEELHPSLCDAVMGRHDSAATINWLQERGLFLVNVGSDAGWCRYHHLVAAQLRRYTAESVEVDLTLLHRRAAEWFRGQGMPERALTHALDAGDDDLVAAVAGQALWPAMLRGETAICRQWLTALDPDTLARNRVSHDVAMFLVTAWGDPAARSAWAESRLRWFGDDDDFILANARAAPYVAEGRVPEVLLSTGEILAWADRYFRSIPGGSLPGFAEAITATALIGTLCSGIIAGEVHHDDERFGQILDAYRSTGPILPTWVLAEWSLLSYVEGAHEKARTLVDQLQPLLHSMDQVSGGRLAGLGLIAAALLESDRTRDAEAQREIAQRLARLTRINEELGWRRDASLSGLALQRTWHRMGNVVEAAQQGVRVDLLLELCPDAAFLRTARDRLREGLDADEVPTDLTDLTDRERHVLDQLDSDLTLDQISAMLGISVNTSKAHVRSIYRKLGVRNRIDAVRLSRTFLGGR